MTRKYPVTLKRAKQIARIRLGRLPKYGHSIVVGGVWIQDNSNYPNMGTCYYQLELINSAGQYYLNEWFKPCVEIDMTKFETIEYKPDSRKNSYSEGV